MMRVLVTGSRDWADRYAVYDALDQALARAKSKGMVVVQGDCNTGADAMARSWARNNAIPCESHPAAWKANGRAAGPRRNKAMVAMGADVCLAFQRGQSKGTQNCIDLCEKAGISVILFTEPVS